MRQKGFTLIELIMAMAVSGLVMAAAVSTIYQVLWGTDRTNSQVVALTDVHQAALRLKKDFVMTQNTDLTDGVPQDSVTLSWTDYTTPSEEFGWEENRDHSSAYNLLSDGVLQRTYDGTTSIVGRNITSVDFITQDGRVVHVVITATGSGASQRSETLEFSVYLRTEGIE